MNVLIAPNAFKNSLAANIAAEAIIKGLHQSRLVCDTTSFPVGDGGDGTVALLIEHLNGKILNKPVSDPLGRKINSSFGFVNQTAIIELADASGLRLLQKNEYDPLRATTAGTGELIKYALQMGVDKVILCIGGSATVDGGVGILQALGIKFLDIHGNELKKLPVGLKDLADIDITNFDNRLNNIELVILCDVENKLLGQGGAASVFGPQKGASKQDVQQLETALTQLRDIAFQKTGIDMSSLKYGGAAGGVSAGLHTFLNARLVNGIEYFLEITNFDKPLQQADLVITGEGSIDKQTLNGKGPYGVAKRAKHRSLPVIGLAGKVLLQQDEELQKYFDVLLPITSEDTDLDTAIAHTYDNLCCCAKLIGELLNISLT